MKKLITLLLTCVLAVALFVGCSTPPAEPSESPSEAPAEQPSEAPSEEPSEDPSEAPMAEEINAAVLYYNYADVYISSVRTALDAELDAMGISYVNYDAANNQATQTDQVNTAISNGANLLIVNIVENSSPDAAQNAVEAARAANIPIIFFNRDFDASVVQSYENSAFVGTDAPEAGHLQGQMIGDFLLANYEATDLNGDGTISYVMFKGQEGNVEADARTQYGVEDADMKLTEAGMPALMFYDEGNADKYLVDQTGSWSAQAATDHMNTLLSEYSEENGNMVELVIANNDGMAEGAISALDAAGYNTGEDGSVTIPVFGVDATATAQQLIMEGKMTGTVKQDAEGMAATIATLAGNIQSGAALMDNTDSFNVDADAAKIRVPYTAFTG